MIKYEFKSYLIIFKFIFKFIFNHLYSLEKNEYLLAIYKQLPKPRKYE
jgi:hypothetical protein